MYSESLECFSRRAKAQRLYKMVMLGKGFQGFGGFFPPFLTFAEFQFEFPVLLKIWEI